MPEIWNGPGDDWYPGDDNDYYEENEDAFFDVEEYDEAKAAEDEGTELIPDEYYRSADAKFGYPPMPTDDTGRWPE